MKIIKATVRSTLLTVSVLMAAVLHVRAATPEMIHYQGVVAVGATPFNGTGDFKFALVNRVGDTTHWSHDGTSTGGAEPTGSISLPVNQGLFSVLLGDTAVAGMTEVLPASVFSDHLQVYVRVWFDDGVNGSAQLAPDTRIVPVGYAMVAAKVCEGAIDGPQLAMPLTIGGDGTPAELVLLNRDGGVTGEWSGGAGDGSGLITLKNDNGDTTAILDARDEGRGAVLHLANNSGLITTEINGGAGDSASLITLKDHQENATLTLDARAGNDGAQINMAKTGGINTLKLKGDLGSGNGGLLLYTAEGDQETVRMTGSLNGDKGGYLEMRNETGTITARLTSQDSPEDNTGKLKLSNENGDIMVTLNGGGSENQGFLRLKAVDNLTRVTVDGDGVNNGGQIKLHDWDGTETIDLRASQGQNLGAMIALKNSVGATTITLDAEANGEGKITTEVLQITGGADLAESFDVYSDATPVEPGLIVSIDPDRPGNLRLSDSANDRTVAGIISGAGDVKPGMLMGQQGTVADGQFPVALTGRVYGWMDASFGSIQPGDLITTSPTTGHGMRAKPGEAQGAIIGKAMTPLTEGRGLVLVLVSLQ